METQIAQYPQIQEFQSLVLAYILLRAGDREAALRLYRDNVELLETRFRDDYTDPDPLLAETLFLFSELAEANGEEARADSLRRQAADVGMVDAVIPSVSRGTWRGRGACSCVRPAPAQVPRRRSRRQR